MAEVSRPFQRICILVPAYNEALRLPPLLREFLELETALIEAEESVSVVILDDGSRLDQSDTMAEAVDFIGRQTRKGTLTFEAIRFSRNRGKGAVLREGFRLALRRDCFDIVGYIDADGATSPKEGMRLIRRLARPDAALDGVLGMRLKCLGNDVQRSWKRHVSGRVFASLVGFIFDIPVYDSQCGAKFFRRAALSEGLLESCNDDRWLFDLELIVGLLRRGAVLHEVPVCWRDVAGSKVNLFSDSISMFFRLLSLRNKMDKLALRD